MTTAPTLSPKQAAARAGVSPGLVYNWCRDGLLAHYRLGARGRRGKILIADADLDRLLATFRVGGGGPPPAPPPATAFAHLRL